MKFSWTPPFIVATGKFTLSKPVPNLIKEEKRSKKSVIQRVSYKSLDPLDDLPLGEKFSQTIPPKFESIKEIKEKTHDKKPDEKEIKKENSIAFDEPKTSKPEPRKRTTAPKEDDLPNEKREGISSEDSEWHHREGISGESYTLNKLNFKLPKYEKDEASEELIKSAIRGNEFLKEGLDSKEIIQAVVEAMYLKNMPADSYVIKEGEPGSHLYVCAKGSFDVFKGTKKVNTLGPGKVFGELALLYNSKRNATIIATTSCSLWVLDRKVFQQIMMKSGLQRIEDNVKFLRSVPLLKKLDKSVLVKMSDLLKVQFFPTDTTIIKQGDEGSLFYIISGGTVTVTVKREDGTENVVGTLQKGDYFGERALLNDDKRMATIIANAPGVECLLLDRKPFIELLGKLEELKSVIIKPEPRPSESQEKVSEYEHVQLNDLEKVGTLGVGGFGRVELVQYKKDSEKVFALKCLKKVHVVELQQQTHAFNEKDIMINCRNPFIARLYKTYKDNKYLYFLMEACLGGDVWTILQKRKFLDENSAKFMTACVVEAFDYLHVRGIVYRDLKPENLLLDAKGYVKLVDFGFAKKVNPPEKTWTFAGTPEYLAPEIILNKGHDRAVDYWSLGIFVHELMVGRPPFRGIDHMKTYNLILKGIDAVTFPKHVNKNVQLLIKKLCRPVPTHRLGYLKEGVAGIKKDRWFQNFDWESLQQTTLKAPFIPIIKNRTDLSNFDSYPKDKDIPPDDLSGWDATF